MIQKKKNKKKIGVILCAIFICLCSILCIIPFNKHEKIEVYADEVVNDVVFNGSSLIVPTARYSFYYHKGLLYNGSYNGLNSFDSVYNFSYLNTYFSVSFRYNQNDGLLQFRPQFYFFNLVDNSLVSNSGTFTLSESVYINYLPSNYSNYKYSLTDTWLNLVDWDFSSRNGSLITDSSGLNYFPSSSTSDVSGVLLDIYTSDIEIDLNKMSYMTVELISDTSGFSSYNIIYYDTNNNYVHFRFFCGNWSIDLTKRTYFFTNTELSDSESYNQGFMAGEQFGFDGGYSNGVSEGYNNGYNVGQNIGYNNGYNAGIQDSNQYTFLNLLSATIDAPVKYFQSLFNFELLGVNLQGFLTGLFTLCVIVTIIKLCLGG